MNRVLVVTMLAAYAALAPAQESESGAQEERWVCVPSRERGWLCGRGVLTPVQTPLPAPEPPAAPPAGYSPPGETARLPTYLRAAPTETREPEPAPAEAPEEAIAPDGARAKAATAADGDGPEMPPADGSSAPPAPDGPAYGVQLVAAREPGTLEAFVQRHGLERDARLQRRLWRDEEGAWHVLVLGPHDSVTAAREVLAALPRPVREAGAWVRRMDTLETPAPSSGNE